MKPLFISILSISSLNTFWAYSFNLSVFALMKSFVKYPFLMIPSEDLNNLEQIEFEGIEVSCPGNPREYMKHQFGDFMKLPPEEKRVGHRPYKLEL